MSVGSPNTTALCTRGCTAHIYLFPSPSPSPYPSLLLSPFPFLSGHLGCWKYDARVWGPRCSSIQVPDCCCQHTRVTSALEQHWHVFLWQEEVCGSKLHWTTRCVSVACVVRSRNGFLWSSSLMARGCVWMWATPGWMEIHASHEM